MNGMRKSPSQALFGPSHHGDWFFFVRICPSGQIWKGRNKWKAIWWLQNLSVKYGKFSVKGKPVKSTIFLPAPPPPLPQTPLLQPMKWGTRAVVAFETCLEWIDGRWNYPLSDFLYCSSVYGMSRMSARFNPLAVSSRLCHDITTKIAAVS